MSVIESEYFFSFSSCKSDSTVKSMSRFPSNRMSSKWQRTIGAQSTLEDEIQSPVEDSEVFIFKLLYINVFPVE